jgi:hypothetical protein
MLRSGWLEDRRRAKVRHRDGRWLQWLEEYRQVEVRSVERQIDVGR